MKFLLALASTVAMAAPTFNKDIAPILYENCATCHRPGEVAPFSLLTYQDAAKRAGLIATVTKLTDNQGNRQVNGTVLTGQTWNRTVALTQSESFQQQAAGASAAVAGTAASTVRDCGPPPSLGAITPRRPGWRSSVRPPCRTRPRAWPRKR